MTSASALKPFRALSSSGSVMNKRAGALWGGGLLVTFIDWLALMAATPYFIFIAVGERTDSQEFTIAFIVAGLLGLAAKIASARFTPGLHLTYRDVASADTAAEGGVFGHRGRFLPLLKWRFATLVMGQVAMSALYVLMFPGLFMSAFPSVELPVWLWRLEMAQENITYQPLLFLGSWTLILLAVSLIWTSFIFVEQAVIFEGRGVLDAVSRSFSLGRGKRLRLLAFFVVHRLFVAFSYIFTSFCLGGVGALPVGAWTRLSRTDAFLMLTNEGETAPPSQAAV